ncbi:MAG: diguanylate cyclase [Deltaproteobacteria bacterium]|jgi:diguanylate cyclase (GGDEF)-like protein|nr:diguanylate cyclase [Deltaproteobacteria bacterium]
MKVLIAEDDLTSRTILGAILDKWGYEVVCAVDGQQALDILSKPDAPKLALLDWNMPLLSGIEVCRKLRNDLADESTYVIILTSRSEKRNIVEGLNTGANDYIIKPYDNEELHARINVGKRMVEIQSELEKAKHALIYEAMHDSLTGLYNRKAILEMLARELSRAKRSKGILHIGMCDLDHFKLINDKYGHQTGDEVLQGFARIMDANLRDYDFIGRYGGEEFLVILPSIPASAKKMNCFTRLHRIISDSRISTRSGEIPVTVSIGVTTADGSKGIDDILAEADYALYRAKETRNSICYSAQCDESSL